MFLNLKCPSCGHSQRVSDEVLGTKVTCPSCSKGFRVGSAKPGPTGDQAAAGNIPRPAAAVSETPPSSPQRQARSEVPRESVPSQGLASGNAASNANRGGLPPWVFAVLGGGAVTVLAAVAVAFQALRGSASAPFPDPAVDVTLGVASAAGQRPGQAVPR